MHLGISAVKFGDCFILRSDYGESFAIDCGSDNRGPKKQSCRQFAYSAIESEVKSGSLKNILVTHFDKDHFCGILEIPEPYKIDCLYLPFTIVEQKTVFSASMSRLLTVASPNSYGVRISELTTELFNKIPLITKRVALLKKGDTFPVFGEKMLVHWPEIAMDLGGQPIKRAHPFTQGQAGDKALSAQESANKAISANMEIGSYDEGDLPSTIAESFDALEKEYFSISQEIESSKYMDVHDIVQRQARLQSSLEDVIGTFTDGGTPGHVSSFATILEDYRLQRFSLLEAFPAGNPLRRRINAYAKKEYQTLVGCMNAISVVCSLNNTMLLLGDAPKNIIEHLAKSGEIKSRYETMKIQHHATDAYFTHMTPSVEIGIVSNGGCKRRKVSLQFVDSGKFDRLICTAGAYGNTNNFCEYNMTHNQCHPSCTSIATTYTLQL